MTRPRDNLYVWVTWLSKLMAGETKCQYAPWFRTHYTGYTKAPSDFQSAVWQAEHTQHLNSIVKERTALQEGIYIEDQNSFRIKRTTGSTIAGKPDLVTIDKQGNRRVFDAKTGAVRPSDTIQVMIYMMLLPNWGIHIGKSFTGYVVYKNHTSEIPASAIDTNFKSLVARSLDILESTTPPNKVCSAFECKYCDLTRDDCTDRLEVNKNEPKEPSESNDPEITI